MGKVDIHMCIKQDGGDMGIPVKLEVFEGPLDLLLHLIDKNKIDIYDIPIVEITNQSVSYTHLEGLHRRVRSFPCDHRPLFRR